MRYARGGGLTDAGRAARERLRQQAVERFQAGQKNAEVAAVLRVSERSVERWRRAWREHGEAGVLSKGSQDGPGSATRKSPGWNASWSAPLTHGWADQRWTLARIKTLIGRLFMSPVRSRAPGAY
ncbi:helix-turn-helix domain-containing protein [Streptomyces sp. DSM 41699]|uniref:Helix-turn-helix domain-containing protein n=1 Tax=Streptomyces gibsoniae TaxID=3075529 RepID=A0ABU2U871_9ACTN|nr:helix-turn-helix domain-containing protein [Streptomyces sp. DSM 41699]MDT0469432.1 helix-turn-helix domain-containing protein [Streptomyces sp. DSM 41699]